MNNSDSAKCWCVFIHLTQTSIRRKWKIWNKITENSFSHAYGSQIHVLKFRSELSWMLIPLLQPHSMMEFALRLEKCTVLSPADIQPMLSMVLRTNNICCNVWTRPPSVPPSPVSSYGHCDVFIDLYITYTWSQWCYALVFEEELGGRKVTVTILETMTPAQFKSSAGLGLWGPFVSHQQERCHTLTGLRILNIKLTSLKTDKQSTELIFYQLLPPLTKPCPHFSTLSFTSQAYYRQELVHLFDVCGWKHTHSRFP